MSGNDDAQTVNLDALSVEELHQLKLSEEEQLQALTNRYGVLRQAAARLSQSSAAVSSLGPSDEGTEVMVPLTESVYVPGTLREPDRLLVDLGTGYYAEKSSKECLEYIDRKIKLVDANSANLSQAIGQTRQNLEAIHTAMQGKLIEIRAKQEGMRHRQQQQRALEG